MGSDLFAVTVRRVEGKELWLECRKLGLVDEIPSVENFGFHLLLDAYAEAPDSAHPMKDKLDAWRLLANGERKLVSEAEYATIVESVEKGTNSNVLSYGVDNRTDPPQFSVTYKPDHRAFVRTANNEVSGISLLPSEQADSQVIHLTVFDAALLHHVKPGAKFASRAYDHEPWAHRRT